MQVATENWTDGEYQFKISLVIYLPLGLSKTITMLAWKQLGICYSCWDKGCRYKCIIQWTHKACQGCRAARRGCSLVLKHGIQKHSHKEVKDKELPQRSKRLRCQR